MVTLPACGAAADDVKQFPGGVMYLLLSQQRHVCQLFPVSYFLSADACSLEESGNEANCSTQRVEGRSNDVIISSIESL